MKIVLLLLSALSLLNLARTGDLPSECTSTLPFRKVCAYGGCFLSIGQSELEILNCERELRGWPPLIFFEDRSCSRLLIPKCQTFDYK